MVDGAVNARRTNEDADRIVFLGHASVLVELDGTRLLTDPLLRGRVVHLRRQVPPLRRDLFADPDGVLISHLHHDHLDLASLRMLGEDVPLIVPAGAAGWLRRRGFATVTELDVGGVTKVGALTVSAVQAHHNGYRPRAPRVASLGYVVSGGRSVYFAGDTELFAEMADLSRAPLDVALLPVAGWGATLGPGHMDPLDAARAAQLIRPRVAIPMHWGTLLPIGSGRRRARLGEPPRLFAEHVADLAPSVEVRILAPGQGIELEAES
jgi:L-ascorbate metabolism protein UlaG (beta-lactamase superfamily)